MTNVETALGASAFMMTFGSLFSGVGGIDLGLERAGMRCAWQVEIDPFCRSVLEKHWPHVRRFVDVHFVSSAQIEPVDVIAAGFPCQDLSHAGRRAGIVRGHRSGLWRECLRIVAEVRPRFVIIENVAHAWRSWVPVVRSDLYRLGYSSLPIRVRASDFGAPHARARVFVVAYAFREQLRLEQGRWGGEPWQRPAVFAVDGSLGSASDVDGERELQPEGRIAEQRQRPSDCDWWNIEPDLARVVHGISVGMDHSRARRSREKALGNSVVPQKAEWIGRRIIEAFGPLATERWMK